MSKMQVYNSISKAKEEFIPLEKNKVKMYVCGPTVYGPGHIGHARTYVAYDVIRRYLEFKGFKVRFIVNITDVHDDMIKRAQELNTTIFDLAEKNIKLFFKDMKELGVKEADSNPRVTEVIPEIIEMIQELEKKGFSYETEDGVYFKISKFPDYGRLSKIKVIESKTGTRVETDKYDKENPHDFALWKKQKPNEPFWSSQWGKGRPGWHIECSAMAKKELGKTIDIHGGGQDLIFPHHENEIAQSVNANDAPFVKYWIHAGFLTVEGEKMSKSLGNYIEIPEMLEKFDAKVFRFFVAMQHYRSGVDFSEKAMHNAAQSLERINSLIESLNGIENGEHNDEIHELIESSKTKFINSMDDDFSSPNAVASLFDFVREINKLISEKNLSKKNAEEALDFLKEIDSIYSAFTFEKKELKIPEEIKKLVNEREQFRKEKKFNEADKIRNILVEKGFQLLDSNEGVKVKKINP